jgi:hypothetical protein
MRICNGETKKAGGNEPLSVLPHSKAFERRGLQRVCAGHLMARTIAEDDPAHQPHVDVVDPNIRSVILLENRFG